jgi:CRP/FNR family transcriptional regulator, dissimilatory nitrate respiration regulator
LSDDLFARIKSITIQLKFNKGQIIFTEGDAGNGFYIVETGKIKVFKLSFEGKEHILHIYGPGHTFGEVPVFGGKNFPASSMALEQSTIIFLERQKFVALISQTPQLGMNMLADLSRRLRDFTIQIENLSLKEVPARLASYILTLTKEQNNPKQVVLPISKVQLSNLIGTTPETISRILKKMTDSLLIESKSKNIIIKDSDELSELSESRKLL